MLFNSLEFILFFPLSIILYFLTSYKYRWIWLLAVSYFFYGWWRADYLILIFVSTVIDYFAAIKISEAKTKRQKKKFLFLSLFSNLGLLFFFKYFNFFFSSFAYLSGNDSSDPLIEVLLPVGISFYTFQTISYTIDVYRGHTTAEKHFGIFAVYVSFWPQLVAGPIERSSHLLPQFKKNFDFDYDNLVVGIKMVIKGFFLKLVIADRIAPMVSVVFDQPENAYGFQVIVAALLFSFQIYGDFAGYSAIAIGSAKIMGFDLMQNFKRPYLATGFKDFWSRWHISLSTWFKDYLYIPLGGNKVKVSRVYFNLFITFLISGLWHGANWTFVVWGALHGIYICVERAFRWNLNVPRFLKIIFVYFLVVLAWIFFRANNVSDAIELIRNIAYLDFKQLSFEMFGMDYIISLTIILFVILFYYLFEIWEESKFHNDLVFESFNIYYLMILIIVCAGVFTSNNFIYFQF